MTKPHNGAAATPISQAQALDAARVVARANGFEWAEANVRLAIDTTLAHRACWRVTMWPADEPEAAFWDQPNDVVTLLPPDILIDATSGALVDVKPLREGLVLVADFGGRYRSA